MLDYSIFLIGDILYKGKSIKHYGIKGQQWGIQNGPPYPLDAIKNHYKYFEKSDGGNYNSNDTVFISGKIKYNKNISGILKNEIDNIIKSNSKIIIGDAPGADTQVQKYLSNKKYKNVTVYTTDENARNNIGNWNVKKNI